MTTIAPTAQINPAAQPQQYPADWQTPDQVLRDLCSPFIRAVHEVLPIIPLAALVGEYADHHLSPNCTRWHTALRNLDSLPERVPPLPANMIELLNRDCLIFRNQLNPDGTQRKIKDTFFLCLAPAGTVDDLAIQLFGQQHNRPYLSDFHLGPIFHGVTAFRQPHLVEFNEPEWFAVSTSMIPGSKDKTFRQQINMILDAREETGMEITFPNFKHAVTANLLYYAIDGQPLWGDRLRSRIFETYYHKSETLLDSLVGPVATYDRNLTISSPSREHGDRFTVGGVPCVYHFDSTGIAALWKISKPTPPPKPRAYITDVNCLVT
jgi:hypothetical protein